MDVNHGGWADTKNYRPWSKIYFLGPIFVKELARMKILNFQS